jgi:hypothetical protein
MTARPRPSTARAALLLAALVPAPAALGAFAGCGASEDVDPVPVPTAAPEPTPDAGPGPTGSPPKRTLLWRSPASGPANNLLFDGDFELSISPGGGQYGWRMFNAAGTTELAMAAETGGLCRSGLTCARFEKGQLLFGRGTAAPGGKGHVMSLYARLPDGVACKEIDLLAVDCDTFEVRKIAGTGPDLDGGFCHYGATFGPVVGAVCFYVSNTLDPGQVAVLDAAVLAPNDGTVPLQATPEGALDAEALATMARVRDLVRRTRPFGRPPVTAPPLRD